ncbi:hypothetical protein, partial [Dialister succinatiphilus]|uniref:hypothetical protein n=1 Tax=Dialister succinatiphilus TaxID=487173 RepID=UPI0040267D8D
MKQRDFGSVVAQSREISCPDAHCTNEVWKFLTSSFDGKERRTCYGQLLSTHLLMQNNLSVKFYSVGNFSRNNKRGKPPLEWKC